MKIPQVEKTEALLLGRMLSSINAANEASFALTVEDFYNPHHRAIFMAIKQTILENLEVENLNVLNFLSKNSPKYADSGYLMNLQLHTFGESEETKGFMLDIKRASMLRQIIHISQNAHAKAHDVGILPEEIQDLLTQQLNQVFSSSLKKTSFTPAQIIANYEESELSLYDYVQKRMEDRQAGRIVLKGIPLGYDRLDNMMKGLCNGHFIIIGARPGVGKSSFVCNWVYRLLKYRKINVGFFSMEMTADQVIGKIVSIASGVNYDSLEDGTCSSEEFRQVLVHAKEVETFPLTIETQDALPVSQVIARAKRMIASDHVKVIFIDYLTRIRGEGKFASKQEEVQSVSKALCAFAKEANIPLVCIAQLNRDIEKIEKPRTPRKSDLAQSGQIEADAHSILLLHRPDTEDKRNHPGQLDVYIVKNRFGKEGKVSFNFNGQTGRYSEVDYHNLNAPEPEETDNDPYSSFSP